MEDNVIECEPSQAQAVVYVGNIPHEASRSEIRYHLRKAGGAYPALHWRSGHVFVTYPSYYDAEQAIKQLENTSVKQHFVFAGDDSIKTKLPMLLKMLRSPTYGLALGAPPPKKGKSKGKQGKGKGKKGGKASTGGPDEEDGDGGDGGGSGGSGGSGGGGGGAGRAKLCLVFVSTRDRVIQLAAELGRALPATPVAGLHGRLSQADRESVLSNFRAGNVEILVATDVAGRGLDVPNIALVCNYDFPRQCEHPCETYAHRIGRCGRAGLSGVAVSIFTGSDSRSGVGPRLVRLLQDAGQKVPKQLAKYASQPIPLDQR